MYQNTIYLPIQLNKLTKYDFNNSHGSNNMNHADITIKYKFQLFTMTFYFFLSNERMCWKIIYFKCTQKFMMGFIQNRCIAESIFHDYLSSYFQQELICNVHLILRALCNGSHSLSKLFLHLLLIEILQKYFAQIYCICPSQTENF